MATFHSATEVRLAPTFFEVLSLDIFDLSLVESGWIVYLKN